MPQAAGAGRRESGADRRGRSGGRPPRPEPPRRRRPGSPVSTNFDGSGTSVRVRGSHAPSVRLASPEAYATGRHVTGRRRARAHRAPACRTTVPRVVLIGLTGGIGSGKSTVSALPRRARAPSSSTPTPSPGSCSSPGTDGVRGDGGAVRRRDRRRRRHRSTARRSPTSSSTTPAALKDLGAIVHPAVGVEIAAPARGRGRAPTTSWSSTCRCSWSRVGTTWPRWWWSTSTRRWPSSGSSSSGGCGRTTSGPAWPTRPAATSGWPGPTT